MRRHRQRGEGRGLEIRETEEEINVRDKFDVTDANRRGR